MLSQLLSGIQHPAFLGNDVPTFSAAEITTIPGVPETVTAVIVSPSGDAFRITVTWLKEVSP
jgi:hypothetical protein